MIERRKDRRDNAWVSVENLLLSRLRSGTAVLADDHGLPVAAWGIPQSDVERAAAALLSSDVPSVVTGSGVGLRLGVTGIDPKVIDALRGDVTRILRAV